MVAKKVQTRLKIHGDAVLFGQNCHPHLFPSAAHLQPPLLPLGGRTGRIPPKENFTATLFRPGNQQPTANRWQIIGISLCRLKSRPWRTTRSRFIARNLSLGSYHPIRWLVISDTVLEFCVSPERVDEGGLGYPPFKGQPLMPSYLARTGFARVTDHRTNTDLSADHPPDGTNRALAGDPGATPGSADARGVWGIPKERLHIMAMAKSVI